MGWRIVLEYGVAGATVAVGFSGYFNSLMGDFGVHIPAMLTTPLIYVADAGTGHVSIGGSVNLIAALIIFLVTRSEEHTSELQSLMRISYAVFCLKKQTTKTTST